MLKSLRRAPSSLQRAPSSLQHANHVRASMHSHAQGERRANRLAAEKSPYLLQHAHNPVDWRPWGEEAFAEAKRRDVPVFLSSGYSTCHWCHVMERESFENDEVAKKMNENFVNVKVDREERPDVDRVYMAFVQATTGGGGWPMSVWLTPQGGPIVGGTYFPRPRFMALMDRIAAAWREERAGVVAQGEQILEALRAETAPEPEDAAGGLAAGELPAALELAERYFERTYDSELGGWGDAPKFPRPAVFPLLLRLLLRHGPVSAAGRRAAGMAAGTLRAMAAGGMRDHLAGGFHRYSVDRYWHVPHFEKMMYDQGQLVAAYLDGLAVTGRPEFGDVAADTLAYVAREMTHPDGGIFSAEDADSAVSDRPGAERKEGAFYVWGAEEVRAALAGAFPAGEQAAAAFDALSRAYGLLPRGNVRPESDPHGEFAGKNVLARVASDEEVARGMGGGRTAAEVALMLAAARRALAEAREGRPRPSRDDKVIAAWNGLMIGAFARAGAALDRPDFLARAEAAARFLRDRMTGAGSGGARLLRSYRGDGPSPVPGYDHDYAYVIAGLLDLYEAGLDAAWLLWARELQRTMDDRLWDDAAGGYFADEGADPTVLLRMKEDYDGAEPAANSVAAHNLLRLARIFPAAGYGERAGRLLAAFKGTLTRGGPGLPLMLAAWDSLERTRAGPSPLHCVIVGSPSDPRTRALAHVVLRAHVPDRTLVCLDGAAGQEAILAAAGDMGEAYRALRPAADGAPYAQLCEGSACQRPVADPAALEALVRPRALRCPVD